ncbi:hypothetical protein FOMPIDRAFT_1052371 [Fomitopsis schrenkii]|uniref:Fungal-type protein kinase domain-containing protein n=1 Tax=Fomitopsis schrenkii TaxID=2126942 RepID=S8E1W7_FOMSC|nr:hypothetical protein FOMPIDRAFT_1052371 [Fomitopsis schrenkii]
MIIDFDYAKFLGDPTLADDLISGTRPFIAGEILSEKHYFNPSDGDSDNGDENGEDADDEDADDEDDNATITNVVPGPRQPTHSFFHDLESCLWILLWYGIVRIGPAMRRDKLWDPRQGTGDLQDIYRRFFTTPGNHALGFNKATLFQLDSSFEQALTQVSKWCAPLKPLLRQLRDILLQGYKARDFPEEQTYEGFMNAFEGAERQLLRNQKPLPPKRQEAYNVEVARRSADRTDWQLPSRQLVSPAASPEEDEEAPSAGEAEAREPTSGSSSDGEEQMRTLTRDLAAEFAAVSLDPDTPPRGNSPTESWRAPIDDHSSSSSESSSPSPTSRRLATSKDQPTAADSSASMPQTEQTTSKQRQPAKATAKAPAKTTAKQTTKATAKAKRPQTATGPSVTQSTGILTRAMKRAASAVADLSSLQTQSQRVNEFSATAAKKSAPTEGAPGRRDKKGKAVAK